MGFLEFIVNIQWLLVAIVVAVTLTTWYLADTRQAMAKEQLKTSVEIERMKIRAEQGREI